MRQCVLATTLVGVATFASACGDIKGARPVCAGVGYYAVRVAIFDQYYRPQALGAVVRLYDGSYMEQDSSTWDPANVLGAEERGGRTYDIQVSKPWYEDVWVRGVKAPGGGCVTGSDNPTVAVPVILTTLLAGAPPVRSVHLVPTWVELDRNRTSFAFTPVVDADLGVSQAVSWRLAGDTASVRFDSLSGTLTYVCRVPSGYLTIRATSRVDTTRSDTARIEVQGHPASSTDPPCATPLGLARCVRDRCSQPRWPRSPRAAETVRALRSRAQCQRP